MRAVVEDYRAAPISEGEKLLFGFLEKVNGEPAAVSAEDVEVLYACGWSDEAIFDALTVCALFNFFNRWVDGSGVGPLSEEGYRGSGHRLAVHGYAAG